MENDGISRTILSFQYSDGSYKIDCSIVVGPFTIRIKIMADNIVVRLENYSIIKNVLIALSFHRIQ